MPTAGAYSWVGSGTYNYSPIPTITVKIPIAPMFTEYLRHVRSLPPSLVPAIPGASPSLNFTYESTVPQLGSLKGGFYDLFWQVKSNASAGDPEGGLVLKRIDTLDSKGNDTGKVFDSGSGPGLLVLPLPAAPGPVGIQTPDGNLSQSISVDTSGNGNNLEFSGTVGPRERVDACGTWLQAWPVDGTLTNGAGSAKIHLDVATQFGAVPLALNFVGDGQTFLGSTLNNVSLHTGQSTPGALPKEWQ
jgi:hypothetical protein